MWSSDQPSNATIKHTEKRANLYYAVLTIPAEVRHIVGKLRFFQSTQTGNKAEAAIRIAILVAGWKTEIAKARGTLPDPKATFWESLRTDFINAKDDAHESVAQDAIEQALTTGPHRIVDPAKASQTWKYATGQATLLAPLVTGWKASLRHAQKTIDQQSRDVTKMAEHFVSVEELTPQKIKAWTDKLIGKGATASTMERMGNGCRSLWAYLQQSGAVSMIEPDPFVGPFKLAMRTAVNNKVGRSGVSYSPDQLAALYSGAVAKGDAPLADLIALGAYTGARIEELCKLTKDTAKDGVFHMGTKTEASLRDCPIHPAVAPLVARMLAASKDGFLVPSTADNQYGNRSGPLSQRFGHLKKALGYGRAHVFHSTRSTLITMMERARVPEGIAADIVGHAKKTITYGLYGTGSAAQQKLDAISKVVFPAALAAP